jgi:hypothetical protein
MTKTTAKQRGKYSMLINKPIRCTGCNALCANYISLSDHHSDCQPYIDGFEFTGLRRLEDIRGDLRKPIRTV